MGDELAQALDELVVQRGVERCVAGLGVRRSLSCCGQKNLEREATPRRRGRPSQSRNAGRSAGAATTAGQVISDQR